jgi:hypothetical protein
VASERNSGRWEAAVTALVSSAGAVVLAVAAVVVPLVAAGSDAVQRPTRGPGPVGDVPQLAQELWSRVRRIVAEQCPAMEAAWLGALVEVESGWGPRAVNPDTAAAGLVQARRSAWMAVADGARARGWPQAGSPPTGDWPGWDPLTHLEVMVPWMCANLAHAADVIERRGLELDAHAGAAVCHIAGCRRLRESTTGVPAAGEAGCDAACAAAVRDYLARIEALRGRYTAVSPTASPPSGAAPAPAPPGGQGCVVADPTGTGGCVTPRAAHLAGQLREAYGTDRAMSCWGRRPTNPDSDHPQGRACDVVFGEIGRFPTAVERQAGWDMASWLVAHAEALAIDYLIWDGQIWQPASGWSAYDGGGVYDPSSPTGGHYDHTHISVKG